MVPNRAANSRSCAGHHVGAKLLGGEFERRAQRAAKTTRRQAVDALDAHAVEPAAAEGHDQVGEDIRRLGEL